MGKANKVGANAPISLLFIDDQPSDFLRMEEHIRQAGMIARCVRVASRPELSQALAAGGWDVALSEFNVASGGFHDNLAFVRARYPELPVILMVRSLSEEMAGALLNGAVSDFVLKTSLTRLVPAIRRALRETAEAGEQPAAPEAPSCPAMASENARQGVVVTDPQGTILAVNPPCTGITGYTEGEILGENLRQMLWREHDPAFYQEMWQILQATGQWQGQFWERRKNGERYLARLSIHGVHGPGGEVANHVCTVTDISSVKSAKQTESPAQRDVLTGLPNRRTLVTRLEHALEISKRNRSQGAVLHLDLDGFKAANDHWGHQAGEDVLRQVAHRLTHRLRDMDTVARMGDHEFVLVLEDIPGPQCAEFVAGEVVALLNQPFELADGRETRIGGSIGIAVFPEHGITAEGLLHQADVALYQAKRGGENTYRLRA